MGFSVSGSFAILILASLVAFGMLYSAGANSFERVSGATHASHEDGLDRQNTAICLTELSMQGNNWLNVNVTNLGSTVLDVAATDVIIDGEYHGVEDAQRVRVDNDPNTELWLPGSVLSLRYRVSEEPERVQVATEHGVSDWQPFPVEGCDVVTDGGDGGGGGGGGGGSGGDDNTTTEPEFISATAEITSEHPNHGVEEVTFTWETTGTADLAFRIYDGNGNVVGSEELTNAGTSGTQVVDVINGANSGGGREPRPIVVEAEIFDTGETCSQTISDGDGTGPFQLC